VRRRAQVPRISRLSVSTVPPVWTCVGSQRGILPCAAARIQG